MRNALKENIKAIRIVILLSLISCIIMVFLVTEGVGGQDDLKKYRSGILVKQRNESADKIVYLGQGPMTPEEISKYYKTIYNGKTIRKDVNFITVYGKNLLPISVDSKNKEILKNDGTFRPPVVSTYVDVVFSYTLSGRKYEVNVRMLAEGYGDEIDAMFISIAEEIPRSPTESFILPTGSREYGVAYNWYINDVRSKDYFVEVDTSIMDHTISLRCDITYKDNTKSKYFSVGVVNPDTKYVRATINQLKSMYSGMYVDADVDLIRMDSASNCEIVWTSKSPLLLSDDGKYTKPKYDTDVTMTATVTKGNSILTEDIIFSVLGEERRPIVVDDPDNPQGEGDGEDGDGDGTSGDSPGSQQGGGTSGQPGSGTGGQPGGGTGGQPGGGTGGQPGGGTGGQPGGGTSGQPGGGTSGQPGSGTTNPPSDNPDPRGGGTSNQPGGGTTNPPSDNPNPRGDESTSRPGADDDMQGGSTGSSGDEADGDGGTSI